MPKPARRPVSQGKGLPLPSDDETDDELSVDAFSSCFDSISPGKRPRDDNASECENEEGEWEEGESEDTGDELEEVHLRLEQVLDRETRLRSEVSELHTVVSEYALEQGRLQRVVAGLVAKLSTIVTEQGRVRRRHGEMQSQVDLIRSGPLSPLSPVSTASTASTASPMSAANAANADRAGLPAPQPGDPQPREMAPTEHVLLVSLCKQRYQSSWANCKKRQKYVAMALSLPKAQEREFHARRLHFNLVALEPRRKWALWHVLHNVPIDSVATLQWKSADPTRGEDYQLGTTRLAAPSPFLPIDPDVPVVLSPVPPPPAARPAPQPVAARAAPGSPTLRAVRPAARPAQPAVPAAPAAAVPVARPAPSTPHDPFLSPNPQLAALLEGERLWDEHFAREGSAATGLAP